MQMNSYSSPRMPPSQAARQPVVLQRQNPPNARKLSACTHKKEKKEWQQKKQKKEKEKQKQKRKKEKAKQQRDADIMNVVN